MLSKKEYQLFKTTDILSISLSCVFIVLFGIKVGWNFFAPKLSETIRAEAIVNAYQIMEMQSKYADRAKDFQQKKTGLKRELASLGVVEKQGMIGMDQWSKPFYFQVRTIDDFKKQIIVWSAGPDGKNNSIDSMPNLSGDDIGESLVANF